MTTAAENFHRDMVNTVEQLKDQIRYNPQRFSQMMHESGGVGAAKRLLVGPSTSDGFTKLWEHGLLGLSVEAHALLPWYADLFSADERAAARYRLEAHGFDVTQFLDDVRSPSWAQEEGLSGSSPEPVETVSEEKPIVPQAPPVALHSSRKDPSLGLRAAQELDAMDLDELTRYLDLYQQATAYDRTVSLLRERTAGHIDPSDAGHRDAVIEWLRQWGCRHLSRADHARTSEALLNWYEEFEALLPNESASLLELSVQDLTEAAIAFDQLSQWPAASRRRETAVSVVRMGPTAAAKTLWAVRPNAFAPWDDPIRDALGFGYNDFAYRSYLELVTRHLRGFTERFSIPVDELSRAVGRPDSTPPKLVDEYYWARITRNLSPGERPT